MSHFILSSRAGKVEIMRLSLINWFLLEILKCIIPIRENSFNEQLEGWFKCCSAGKPGNLFE